MHILFPEIREGSAANIMPLQNAGEEVSGSIPKLYLDLPPKEIPRNTGAELEENSKLH